MYVCLIAFSYPFKKNSFKNVIDCMMSFFVIDGFLREGRRRVKRKLSIKSPASKKAPRAVVTSHTKKDMPFRQQHAPL
jgi:hypothetical protein